MSAVPAQTKLDLSTCKWPVFDEEIVSAASDVLRSGKINYWTGPLGRQFEAEFANYFGVDSAIAMANGTVTLQACLRALEIGIGDEVITTPRTFIGTSSSIVMEGATPVCVDVCRDSGNITAETIEPAITSRTKAIMPVHLGGWPCDMPAIMRLAKQHGLRVIEDCAQSHGAKIDGEHAGSFGDISSWSFCQDKIMTTGGEGGMIGTNDAELWSKAWSLKDHGKSFDAVFKKEHKPGFRWVHENWGTNWRLTEFQSAIGLKQLERLPQWTAIRTRNAMILTNCLSDCPLIRLPQVPSNMVHAYYKLYAYVRPEALKSDWSRDRILSELESRGVPGLSGSCSEIYLEGAFVNHGYAVTKPLPVAHELGETSIMFLVHPTITENVAQQMGEIIRAVITAATR